MHKNECELQIMVNVHLCMNVNKKGNKKMKNEKLTDEIFEA